MAFVGQSGFLMMVLKSLIREIKNSEMSIEKLKIKCKKKNLVLDKPIILLILSPNGA